MDKIKIVLADDHDFVRKGLSRLLGQYPEFEIVGEAADGSKAIEVVERLQPDVVVCDIRMPVLNGIEVVRRLKEQHPEIKVIALSAYDEDEYIVALVQAGAAGYMLKTADVSELAQAIRAAHLGEMVIHPAIAARLGQLWTQMSPAVGRELTPREMEILRLAADGQSNKAIASQLKLSIRTIEAYLGRIYSKMGVSSRAKATHYAFSKNIIDPENKLLPPKKAGGNISAGD